ncbi:MAG: class I SAM-dependent methyltransferase [Paludibacter sp.]|nr:class I SAM-dependent methyltransferase [Paludibacter sp.]
MKVRDSGMPEETKWNDFFNTDLLLSELSIDSQIVDLVEIGSGYGTFTIPTAKLIHGKLYAFDIEEEMIENLIPKIRNQQIDNIVLEKRDILAHTTGLPDNSIDYIMLFNILHHDSPLDFIDEAYRILKPEGKIGIIHWRSDITTPRGPDLKIRPKPEQIIEWIDEHKFRIDKHPFIIEPYHFGLIISKI